MSAQCIPKQTQTFADVGNKDYKPYGYNTIDFNNIVFHNILKVCHCCAQDDRQQTKWPMKMSFLSYIFAFLNY